jgi:hypothetical protein
METLRGSNLNLNECSFDNLTKIPSRIFIVPYRDRPQHKFFFCKYMQFIMEDQDDYEIYFAHQCDDRVFNRGAAKNLGFLAIKAKYPNHYKDMIFIFNDVDTLPFNKIFTYTTQPGTVSHYYGFKHTLGGIVVMMGHDFERINGFPCIWGWGQEDNCLQQRCIGANILIDRSTFYPIGSPQILQLFDGISRIVNKTDAKTKTFSDIRDGLSTLTGVQYTINSTSLIATDNQFTVHEELLPKTFYINVTNFATFTPYNINAFVKYDLRDKGKKTKGYPMLNNANVYQNGFQMNTPTSVSHKTPQNLQKRGSHPHPHANKHRKPYNNTPPQTPNYAQLNMLKSADDWRNF